MIANNGDFLCEAAVAGLGVAILPTFMIWREMEQGRLVYVLPDCSLPSVNAYAVYPQTLHLSQRVRTFIDFLSERFSGEPYWDSRLEVGSSE